MPSRSGDRRTAAARTVSRLRLEQPLTDLRALPLPVLVREDVILEIVHHLLEALDRAEVAVHHLVEQHVQREPGTLRQQLRLALPSTHRLLHVETGRESERHQEPVTGEHVDLGLGEVGHHAAIAVVDGGRSQHHEHVIAEQLHLRPLTAMASVLHHQGMQPELRLRAPRAWPPSGPRHRSRRTPRAASPARGPRRSPRVHPCGRRPGTRPLPPWPEPSGWSSLHSGR